MQYATSVLKKSSAVLSNRRPTNTPTTSDDPIEARRAAAKKSAATNGPSPSLVSIITTAIAAMKQHRKRPVFTAQTRRTTLTKPNPTTAGRRLTGRDGPLAGRAMSTRRFNNAGMGIRTKKRTQTYRPANEIVHIGSQCKASQHPASFATYAPNRRPKKPSEATSPPTAAQNLPQDSASPACTIAITAVTSRVSRDSRDDTRAKRSTCHAVLIRYFPTKPAGQAIGVVLRVSLTSDTSRYPPSAGHSKMCRVLYGLAP